MMHHCASSTTTLAGSLLAQHRRRICCFNPSPTRQVTAAFFFSTMTSPRQRKRFAVHQPTTTKAKGRGANTRPLAKRSPYLENREIPALDDVVVPQRVQIQKHVEIEFEGVQSRLSRQFISNILDQFARQPNIRELAAQQNITKNIFNKAFQSFRLYCCYTERANHLLNLEPALRVVFSDIQTQDQSVDSLYPYFVKHAHKVFPHLDCTTELQKISDLTQPHNWYPLARELHRRVVFHAGPTNSGKTYEALQVFKRAQSGIYCGPLRLLAYEVYERINKEGVPCDMVTGEHRLYANGPDQPAAHCTYTTEMLSPEDRRDVCIIDEIQMLRDPCRGAAWTRALLAAAADEVHLCGEEAAIDIVIRLLDPIGEHVDVRRYERKGDLVVISTHGLRDLANIQDGDCMIHFSKQSILETARKLRTEHKREAAIIFGDLPPETKKAQVARFNDPADPCKVMLATDAVGMGMNLNIKRVIFTTLTSNFGEIKPAYFVKQIAGRAGRFASSYCTGEVMTFKDEDALLLKRLMEEPIKDIERAGIAPSCEMIELFSIHLPHCSLTQLLDIFISICTTADEFFVCVPEQMYEIAELIEHIPLSLRDRYTFCLCPLGQGFRMFLNAAYVKMVRRYSQGNAVTIEWLRPLVMSEMRMANTLDQLNVLVDVYDLLYVYLWLSFRMEEYFPHREQVQELQNHCGELVTRSLEQMIGAKLLDQQRERELPQQQQRDNKTVVVVDRKGQKDEQKRQGQKQEQQQKRQTDLSRIIAQQSRKIMDARAMLIKRQREKNEKKPIAATADADDDGKQEQQQKRQTDLSRIIAQQSRKIMDAQAMLTTGKNSNSCRTTEKATTLVNALKMERSDGSKLDKLQQTGAGGEEVVANTVDRLVAELTSSPVTRRDVVITSSDETEMMISRLTVAPAQQQSGRQSQHHQQYQQHQQWYHQQRKPPPRSLTQLLTELETQEQKLKPTRMPSFTSFSSSPSSSFTSSSSSSSPSSTSFSSYSSSSSSSPATLAQLLAKHKAALATQQQKFKPTRMPTSTSFSSTSSSSSPPAPAAAPLSQLFKKSNGLVSSSSKTPVEEEEQKKKPAELEEKKEEEKKQQLGGGIGIFSRIFSKLTGGNKK